MSDGPTRSWWHLHRKLIRILIVLLLFIGGSIFVTYAYEFQLSWTGFNASQGPNVQQYQPTKTLWDWLQLLFVPIVLSVAAYWFNRVNSEREQKLGILRDKTERAIALDSQRAALLQDYLDRMSDLLIGQKLCDPQTSSEARHVARARTLIVLPQLDDKRKGRLIQFLYESQLLILGTSNCIPLHNADLSGANLSGFDLMGINLTGADLSKTQLKDTNLSEAQLQGTCLHEADLSGATLRSTNLCNADLSRAKLNGARLQEAKLLQANLSQAQFAWTVVTKADFSDAIINGIKIEETAFDDAILSTTQVEKIKQLQKDRSR